MILMMNNLMNNSVFRKTMENVKKTTEILI